MDSTLNGPDADALLRDYYEQRAGEYDEIYGRADPLRQAEQNELAAALRAALAGRHVLEIACGTGYWTRAIADVAAQVVATDASEAMLKLARDKGLPPDKVTLRRADAYALADLPGSFDAAVACFWLSHVPRDRLPGFLAQLHARLARGAIVFLADNVFVPRLGGELLTRAGQADTFKRRTLRDGSVHEIVKNYYSADELRALLQPASQRLQLRSGQCFWWARYATA